MSVTSRGKDPIRVVRGVVGRPMLRQARRVVDATRRAGASARYGARFGKLPPEQRPYVNTRERTRALQRWEQLIARRPLRLEDYQRMRRPIEIEQFIECHVCGAREVQPMFRPRGRDRDGEGWSFFVVRCPSCGLIYRNPGVKPERLGDLYAKSYATFLSGDYATKRLRRYSLSVEAWAPLFDAGGGRRLLDFGCGTGLFLEMAHERGFDTYGVDLSEDSIRRAREREGGQNAFFGSPIDVPEIAAGGFDVITMWSVLAHLARPLDDLSMLRSLLAPGGALMIFTVNANSLLVKRYGGRWNGFAKNHLSYFSAATLERMLRRAGFSQVEFRPFYGDTIEAGTTRLAPDLVAELRRVVDQTDQGNMMRALARI